MNNPKSNRKRKNAITIRMNDEEYKNFQDKVKDSGVTQQAFVIESVNKAVITSSDEVAELKTLSNKFSDLVVQLRGLATNVNQMTHVANGQGILPQSKELAEANNAISHFRKECEELWLSIRLLIHQQNHTQR